MPSPAPPAPRCFSPQHGVLHVALHDVLHGQMAKIKGYKVIGTTSRGKEAVGRDTGPPPPPALPTPPGRPAGAGVRGVPDAGAGAATVEASTTERIER